MKILLAQFTDSMGKLTKHLQTFGKSLTDRNGEDADVTEQYQTAAKEQADAWKSFEAERKTTAAAIVNLRGTLHMSWPSMRLEEAAQFSLGKMLDQRKNQGELLPYLANVNVRWGSFDLHDLRQMRFEPSETDRFGLRHGDVVMCEGSEPGRWYRR